MNKGQVSPIILWAIGFIATSGFGLTLFGMNSDARQDTELSKINREVGEFGQDIKYIKEAVDDLRQAQGIRGSALGTTTNQTLFPYETKRN